MLDLINFIDIWKWDVFPCHYMTRLVGKHATCNKHKVVVPLWAATDSRNKEMSCHYEQGRISNL